MMNTNNTAISQTVEFNRTAVNAEYQLANQTAQGKRIVDTLLELELETILGDQHAQAVHQLIVAAVVIMLICIVMIGTVLLFRCYMLYCQDYLNIRRYQMPPATELQHMQPVLLPTVPPTLVPRHNRRTDSVRVSFHDFFDDDEPPFIKVNKK